ncbi:2OG-Fe(II) oxygenase [Variovorax sp. 160MFSha2.1]|uniref:2OG-Fe(II) oxygenase n=1 Tax=Variovorax sp. 160MFSha2.1 TaxID=3158367 RepID=UPI003AAB5DB5
MAVQSFSELFTMQRDIGAENACGDAGVSVSVHDGEIADDTLTSLSQALAWVPMYFLKRTERDPEAHPLDMYWYYPLVTVNDRYQGDAEPELEALPSNLEAVQHVWRSVQKIVPGTVRLYECEYTANSFGTEGHPHHDSPREELRSRHVTAILYCNNQWRLEWAGETVIFNERHDIHAAVLPKAGRICLIEGDPLHVARGVSRICPEARRVLVFKMWRED